MVEVPTRESCLLDPKVQPATVNQGALVSLLRNVLTKMDGFLCFGVETLLVNFSFVFPLFCLSA